MLPLVILIVSILGVAVNAADTKVDDRFSMHHPISNSTFKHWKALGSAIFLEDKAILAPELRYSRGLIYNKDTFNL